MRSPVKSAISVVTLGVLGASWYAGQSAVATNSGQFAAPQPTGSSSPSATPSDSSSPSSSSNSNNNGSSNNGSNNNSGSNSKPSTKPSSAPSQTTPAQPTTTEVTKDGEVVESGFGTVQVRVTKTNGKITAIDLLQANATHGRAGAFPYLVQYAIAANGANFSNLSGATFTTNAFKTSLRSALAKF